MTARRRKVLHIAPTPFFSDRGCHIRIEGILHALNNQDVESILCTYHHGRDRGNIKTLRIGNIANYQDTSAGPKSPKYFADIKLFALVCQQLRSFKPDIIHAYLHEGIALGWAAKWATLNQHIPLVADIQGSLVGELDSYDYFGQSKQLRRLFQRIEHAIVQLPHHTFCSSAASLQLLQDTHAIDPNWVSLLNDSIKPYRPFDRKPKKAGDKISVLYSGSLLNAKGLSQLKQIAVTLLSRRQDVELLLIGYPVTDTKAFLQERGLMDRCRMTGQVDVADLPSYLEKADIALDPKREGAGEGSGKIINYMAAGLPIVAFDSINNKALLGSTQTLIGGGSIEHFVQAIEALIDDPKQRRIEGERNRKRVEELFNWDRNITEVIKAYNRLAPLNPINDKPCRAL